MNGKEKLVWNLQFQLNSDWLLKGASQKSHIDTAPLIDGLGRPYIPASSLKGLIRQEFQRLRPVLNIGAEIESYIFGEPGAFQGHAYFEDGTMEGAGDLDSLSQVRTRVAVERKRKVVRDEAIMMEQVVIPNIPLHSSISCYVPAEKKNATIAGLTLAILSISSVGSGKSIGRGRVQFTYTGGDEASGKVWLEVHKGRNPETKERIIEMITKEQLEQIITSISGHGEGGSSDGH